MNEVTVREAARERRFEAELAEVLGRPIAAVHGADAPRAGARSAWWLAAAFVVGAATVVLVAHERGLERMPAQEPVVAEPPQAWPMAYANTAAELRAMPADAQRIGMYMHEKNADFEPFRRLVAARAIAVNGPDFDAKWPREMLAPFAVLPRLEVLEVPLQPGMTAEHLRALAPSASLRFLTLHLKRPLTPGDVEALQGLPKLCSLTLQAGWVDAASVRALSTLGALDALTLWGVAGDEEMLVQLRTVHRLRVLRLEHLGRTSVNRQPILAPGLTPAVAAALGELPLLEMLELATTHVAPEAIARLPEGLRGFSLTSSPDAGADVLLALRRFGKLRQLTLDNQAEAHKAQRDAPADLTDYTPIHEAQAELVRTLPLTELRYLHPMPEIVRDAVKRSTSLAGVELTWARVDDITTVASVRSLQRLRLTAGRFGIEDLRCLAKHPHFRRLELGLYTLLPESVQPLLPGVEVTTPWK